MTYRRCSNIFICSPRLNGRPRPGLVYGRHSIFYASFIYAGCPQGSVLGPRTARFGLPKLGFIGIQNNIFFADNATAHYAALSSHETNTSLSKQHSLKYGIEKSQRWGRVGYYIQHSQKNIQQTIQPCRVGIHDYRF